MASIYSKCGHSENLSCELKSALALLLKSTYLTVPLQLHRIQEGINEEFISGSFLILGGFPSWHSPFAVFDDAFHEVVKIYVMGHMTDNFQRLV
jgi:hypothetical protein